MSKLMLFSPGPVLVEDNVKHALLHREICHRSKEFEDLYARLQQKIKVLFGADDSYYPLLVSGSGTSANETVLSSLFGEGDQVLLVTNGMFGERLEEIIRKYEIPMIKAETPWSQLPDLADIEAKLRENPKIKVIAMVFHETSTAMINPIPQIGALSKKYGKTFFVDCVSAAGGEIINMAANNIDVATSVGGKCVGAFPGSAYLCAKESLLQTITAGQCKNVYLNLYKHYAEAKRAMQTPNTPNVTLYWALEAALDNILAMGLDGQVARYRENAGILRAGLKRLGLRLLIEENLSNTVTSVFLPEGVDLDRFLLEMEDTGYVLYAGKGEYKSQGMFQVANMGAIAPGDCQGFLKVLEAKLESMVAVTA